MAARKKTAGDTKTGLTAGQRKKSVSKAPAPKKSTGDARTRSKRKVKAKSSSASARAAEPKKDRPKFPIVGLGASAGGLEALESFFTHMPPDSGMAFVVVVHQAAKHVSLLPELLDKRTRMAVAPIRDRMVLEPNCVYIVPPGKNVDLLDSMLHLTDLPEKHAAPLPIDFFFRSLAQERREMAVGIVMSGTGTDGTVGLSEIKGESGMVMVQSVESAKFAGMPRHAIDAGLADYVLPPPEMPRKLIAYARGPFLRQPPAVSKPAPAFQLALPEILLKLRRRCGHDFSGYKNSTICRRIERRLHVHQISEPQQYLRFLDERETEADALFRDLLIGVTSFFREAWAFETLAEKALLPRLRENRNDAEFRVWVPGCSTGEEAYSIAILLRECMDELKIHVNPQIFATDLDDLAIETARGGLFPSGICADVSAQRLSRHFTKEDGSYRIRKELRDWLVFAPQNVIHDPPFTKLDLISCRNLLIYMQPTLQKKLLTLFHYSLLAGGCLFLGTSETINEFDDLFQSLDAKSKVFRRKEAQPRPGSQVQFPVVGTKANDQAGPPERSIKLADIDMRHAITQMLVDDFAPATVVVSESGEIVHVHGRTGMFLELAPGGPPKNVISMAREGLELDLSAALRKAARQDLPVLCTNVPVKTNGDSVLINLIVQKVAQPKSIRGLLRISFQLVEDVVPPVADTVPEEQKPVPSRKRPTSREQELQRELQQTRESLQRTIEELDASNEEMKSTNEELQSTNEELQSTNEELETSKEELQSLNEELQTVNAEFQEKIRELSTANDDMNNLLNSTDIATIFLDNTLQIKRYTEQAKRIVSLIPTDVGRSLTDLTLHLLYDGLVSDAERVLKTLIPKECEVQTEDGTWLLMRILPYRTAENRIEGLVLTFVDVNALRSASDALRESLTDSVPMLISCIGPDGRYVFANSAYEQMTGKTRQQLAGMHFRAAIGEEAYAAALPHFEAALSGESRHFESKLPCSDGRTFRCLVQFVPRRDENARVIGVYELATDIAALRTAEEERAMFEGIVETIREPLLVLDGELRVQRANRSFYDTFRVTSQATVGRLIYELGDNQWDIPALRTLLEDILPKNAAFDDFDFSHDFPTIGPKHMLLNARRIMTKPGQPSMILLVMEVQKRSVGSLPSDIS